MKDMGLEQFKEYFKDDKVHFEVGRIIKTVVLKDLSMIRCLVKILPTPHEVVAIVSWEASGTESGIFDQPIPDDLVLVAFSGQEQTPFVVRRLSSRTDKIPVQVKDGHMVVRSKLDKKLYIGSNVKTMIGKIADATDYTENLVLGQQLKTLLSDILNELKTLSTNLATHTHIGNLGFETSPPQQEIAGQVFTNHSTFFDEKKASPVEDEVILSDVVFTHKGD